MQQCRGKGTKIPLKPLLMATGGNKQPQAPAAVRVASYAHEVLEAHRGMLAAAEDCSG